MDNKHVYNSYTRTVLAEDCRDVKEKLSYSFESWFLNQESLHQYLIADLKLTRGNILMQITHPLSLYSGFAWAKLSLVSIYPCYWCVCLFTSFFFSSCFWNLMSYYIISHSTFYTYSFGGVASSKLKTWMMIFFGTTKDLNIVGCYDIKAVQLGLFWK